MAEGTYRLAEGAALLCVGGRPTLHCGEKLYALDPVTELLARLLGSGTSFARLVEALVADGLTRARAERYVRRLLRLWSANGVAEADLPERRAEAGPTQGLRIAHLEAELRLEGAGLHDRVRPEFAHLACRSDAAPHLTIEAVEADGLVHVRAGGDGGALVVTHREAVPSIKALLTERLLALAPPDIALHAACLVRGGRALLLTGSPGAGKTTLSVALSHAGFDLAADDISLLDPEGRVRGAPFAPAIKSGAWPLLSRLRPDLPGRRAHLRSDGARVRYLPPLSPPVADSLKVGWIVHLCRLPGAAARLRPLEPAETLARLVGEAHSAAGAASLETMRMLISVAEQARGFDLAFSDLDDAVRTLADACAERRS